MKNSNAHLTVFEYYEKAVQCKIKASNKVRKGTKGISLCFNFLEIDSKDAIVTLSIMLNEKKYKALNKDSFKRVMGFIESTFLEFKKRSHITDEICNNSVYYMPIPYSYPIDSWCSHFNCHRFFIIPRVDLEWLSYIIGSSKFFNDFLDFFRDNPLECDLSKKVVRERLEVNESSVDAHITLRSISNRSYTKECGWEKVSSVYVE